MDLVNQKITHKVFGEGNIVDHDDSYITVDFNEDTKVFVYPDAFGSFIKLNDQNTAQSLKEIVSKRKKEEEELQNKQNEERKQNLIKKRQKAKLKNHKIHESSQAVFWLDEEELQSVFTDWQVSTGTVQSGKSKGQPNRAARLQPNSAILLTTREKEQPESERRVLGLYMVTETFSGDFNDDGLIPAHAEFRIELTAQESEKMLFWNYYINKNFPDRMTWNSGRYRYFSNLWAAQILKDIIDLKTDEEEIRTAESFLEYFCQMNALDIENISEANGALKQ